MKSVSVQQAYMVKNPKTTHVMKTDMITWLAEYVEHTHPRRNPSQVVNTTSTMKFCGNFRVTCLQQTVASMVTTLMTSAANAQGGSLYPIRMLVNHGAHHHCQK